MIFWTGYKQPAERYPVGVDLVNLLETGETILTIVATAMREDDGSDQTATFLDGTQISGTKALAMVKDGLTTKTYKVSLRITTSEGKIIEADIMVPVKEL